MKKALKEVRGKKILLKMKHKLKRNLRARSKNKELADMEKHLEKKGIAVNKETLKQRVKKRKGIAELEKNQDALAKKLMNDGDDSDEMIEDNQRGRKRKRSISSDDGYMEVDEENDAKSQKKSSKSKLRSLSAIQ